MAVIEVRTESSPRVGTAPGILLLVSGVLDRASLRRLQGVVEALVTTPSPVTVDVSSAKAQGLGLARLLCTFRSQRRDVRLPVRVVGLHPDNVPGPEGLALSDLFVVYEQVRDAA